MQLLGDGVMCAFGVPRVAEDDAIRAVRAAVGIQDAFREFAREESALVGTVGHRVAVNTGEVVEQRRLCRRHRRSAERRRAPQAGGPRRRRADRRVDRASGAGAGDAGSRREAHPEGSETVAAYRVVLLDRPAGASAIPFVGREDELRRIMAVHDAAVATRRARLAVILGSPGLGKSRL